MSGFIIVILMNLFFPASFYFLGKVVAISRKVRFWVCMVPFTLMIMCCVLSLYFSFFPNGDFVNFFTATFFVMSFVLFFIGAFLFFVFLWLTIFKFFRRKCLPNK